MFTFRVYSQERSVARWASGWSSCARRFRFPLRILLAALVAAYCLAEGAAAEPGPVVRIEEDWSIEIGVPDPSENAPQIITVLSPTDSLNGVHVVFELNHATLPEYQAGGMQLQRWHGDQSLDVHNFPNLKALGIENETITYTMTMSLEGNQLKFEVLNGNSSTWGNFGGQGYLKSILPTDLTHLGSYSLNTSVEHSRVGFASHRVKKFVRTQVRYYSIDGLVATDTTERVVHSYNGGV